MVAVLGRARITKLEKTVFGGRGVRYYFLEIGVVGSPTIKELVVMKTPSDGSDVSPHFSNAKSFRKWAQKEDLAKETIDKIASKMKP